MNLSDYIKHPERLDKETLPRLEKLVGDYPYFQPARLLYLRNLYLLHFVAPPFFCPTVRPCSV